MKVLRINATDTYPIRSKILRPGCPTDSCIFEKDEDDQSFHLGAFTEGKLVSVASFYFENHPSLPAEYQFRLRGMATLQDFRGQGFSSALLKTAFPIVKQNLCQLLWCNARKSAIGFYEKVGFQAVGEEFDVAGIGPHLLMYKELGEK